MSESRLDALPGLGRAPADPTPFGSDQGVHPEVWETDEELDAFLADLYARRRAGSSAS
jgi:hypothetical protein